MRSNKAEPKLTWQVLLARCQGSARQGRFRQPRPGVVGGSALSIAPGEDVRYLLASLVVVIVGGMGSIVGAFWGGMTIGLVQQLSTLFVPIQLQNTAIFVVFLLVLLIKPEGFFGRTVERA